MQRLFRSIPLALAATVGIVIACRDDGSTAPDTFAPDFLTVATPLGLLQTGFTTDASGLVYADDGFRGTNQPSYASGAHVTSGGFSGGALRVSLGGVNNNTISNMSGGWRWSFSLAAPSVVSVTLRYNLTQSPNYESDENSQALASLNGTLIRSGANDYLARIVGNGNGGSNRTTGWVLVTLDLGTVSAGNHELALGAYNNRKNASNETTTLLIDDLSVSATEMSGDSWMYLDNAFRGTTAGAYASGDQLPNGSLRVSLGGVDGNTVSNMSGGWRRSFTVETTGPVTATVVGSVTQSPNYESDEVSQLLVSVNGVLKGTGGDFVAQVAGNGNGGTNITTGTITAVVDLGVLAAGSHVLTVGGYNSKKTLIDEWTEIVIDDVTFGVPQPTDAGLLATQLDFQRFQDNIQTLAAFGDRTQGAASNLNALDWIEQQLTSYGYTVERHPYTYNGAPRENIHATKIGSRFPDRMYIVSAHMDGRGGGGGADDDASGTSLVLEAARVMGQAEVQTDYSVRFILWNNEETGLNGSAAYVASRAPLRGIENPAGSGLYPEPSWLGMIQHDMILFDHGLPVQPQQIPGADVDVEYQSTASFNGTALTLGQRLIAGNAAYSTDYPAQLTGDMRNTDSWSFRNHTAAVSVRENRRIAEIGNGSNPHWHQPTDVFTTYSQADFRLGFNALQMTFGTVADLAGARIIIITP